MAAGPLRRPWLAVVAALVAAALLWWVQGDGSPVEEQQQPGTSATASTSVGAGATDPGSGLPVVAAADLPVEARDTLQRIDDGGPHPYDQDDSVFSNREGLLPDHPEGYYHEYTVETPGSPDRGARRIVAGSDGELYWTDDHYQSFSRITR